MTTRSKMNPDDVRKIASEDAVIEEWESKILCIPNQPSPGDANIAEPNACAGLQKVTAKPGEMILNKPTSDLTKGKM